MKRIARTRWISVLVLLAACGEPVVMDVDATMRTDAPGSVDAGADTCEPTLRYRDVDGDGFGDLEVSMASCAPLDGWVDDGADCDDRRAEANPSASETCNVRDDDCDGRIDEGLLVENPNEPVPVSELGALPLQQTVLIDVEDGQVAIFEAPAPEPATGRALFLRRLSSDGYPMGEVVELPAPYDTRPRTPAADVVRDADGAGHLLIAYVERPSPYRIRIADVDPSTLSVRTTALVAEGIAPPIDYAETILVVAVEGGAIVLYQDPETGIVARRYDVNEAAFDEGSAVLSTADRLTSAMRAEPSADDGRSRVYLTTGGSRAVDVFSLEVEDALTFSTDPVARIDETDPNAVFYQWRLELPIVRGGLRPGEPTVVFEVATRRPFYCARTFVYDESGATLGACSLDPLASGFLSSPPVHDDGQVLAVFETMERADDDGRLPLEPFQAELVRFVPVGSIVDRVLVAAAPSLTTGGRSAFGIWWVVRTFYGDTLPGDAPPSFGNLSSEELAFAGAHEFPLPVLADLPEDPTILAISRMQAHASSVAMQGGRATMVLHQPVGEVGLDPTLLTYGCAR